MNLERAAMKGKLADARQQQVRLRNRIEGQAVAIRMNLNTAITLPDRLDVPVIDEQWDQLKSAWAELIVVNADIDRLERELN